MKKLAVNSFILVLILPILISCSKQNDFGEHGSIIIEYGTVCGWCGGEEAITVSAAKADYLRQIPCGENEGTTNKTVEISREKWNDIISSFDYSYFLTLNYNECNVCVDGCDEFIKITADNSIHEIRYSPSIEIDGLENLREKLNNVMNEMASD